MYLSGVAPGGIVIPKTFVPIPKTFVPPSPVVGTFPKPVLKKKKVSPYVEPLSRVASPRSVAVPPVVLAETLPVVHTADMLPTVAPLSGVSPVILLAVVAGFLLLSRGR